MSCGGLKIDINISINYEEEYVFSESHVQLIWDSSMMVVYKHLVSIIYNIIFQLQTNVILKCMCFMTPTDVEMQIFCDSGNCT